MIEALNVDKRLSNADWPKRTPDKVSDLNPPDTWDCITGNAWSEEQKEKHPHAPKGIHEGGQFTSTHMPDIMSLVHIKDLPGSTQPTLMEDPNGKQWVMKKPNSKLTPDHLQNEEDANAVYRALGVAVPHSGVADDGGGGKVKLGEYLKGGQDLATWQQGKSQTEKDLMYKQIQKGFVADCLLANWDVVGLSNDNIMVKDGVPYRVDNGGALKYRAQGALKGSKFGTVVGELETLRDKSMNGTAATVFKGISNAEIKGQIEHIVSHAPEITAAIKDPETKKIVAARISTLLKKSSGGMFDSEPVPPPPRKKASDLIKPAPKPATVPTGGNIVPPAYSVITGNPQEAKPSYSEATHLHNAEALVEHIKSKSPPGVFTAGHFQKMKHLNPEGVKDGLFYCPNIRVKGKDKEAMGKAVAALTEALPTGTQIRKAKISLKSPQGVWIKQKFKKIIATAGDYQGGHWSTTAAVNPVVGEITTGKTLYYEPYTLKIEKNTATETGTGLEPAERSAVVEWKSGCSSIRKSISKGTLTSDAKHVLSAITKLPKISGTLFRGVSGTYSTDQMAAIEQAGIGGTWQDSAPMGASRNIQTARSFSGGKLFFKIKTVDARMIAKVGHNHHGEEECLLPHGSVFTITGIHKTPKISGHGEVEMVVELEQIPGSHHSSPYHNYVANTSEQVMNKKPEKDGISPEKLREQTLQEMMGTATLTDKDGNLVWVGEHVKLNPDDFELLATA